MSAHSNRVGEEEMKGLIFKCILVTAGSDAKKHTVYGDWYKATKF